MTTRLICLLVLMPIVVACSIGYPQPISQADLPPIEPMPTARLLRQPTVASQGAALPGRLLFVKDGNLWLWQGESGHQLTETGDSFQPAWSPDGTRIAFVQRGESYSDLMLMPAAEPASPRNLTSHSSTFPPHSYERIYDSMWAFYPAFAPGGATIAFASQYGPPSGAPAVDYRLALFTTSVGEGGGKALLYANPEGHVGRLVYAPDGQTIVFAYGPAGPDVSQLYRYHITSTIAEPFPGLPEQSYDPTFSPDGRWLAFVARDEGRTDVFAMLASGGTLSRLTSLGTARAPAFSRDGSLLAFLAVASGGHGFDLWVAELQQDTNGVLSARNAHQITHDLGIDADSGIAWGP